MNPDWPLLTQCLETDLGCAPSLLFWIEASPHLPCPLLLLMLITVAAPLQINLSCSSEVQTLNDDNSDV